MLRLLFLFCFLLPSCEKKELETEFAGFAMTMQYRIIISHPLNQLQKEKVNSIIYQVFNHIDATFNIFNPDSELSKLNALKANKIVTISKEMESLLTLTKKIVQISKRRFDPSIHPLQKLWKEHLVLGTIPKETAIAKILPYIGFHHFHFENGHFWKDHDKSLLDFGGIAKGYAIDLILEKLLQEGFYNLFIEWGGEIAAKGSHQDLRPWTIFISRFGDPNPLNAIATIALHNQSIATSGDYMQNWSVDGDHYSHIIDPFTHFPLKITKTSIGSVSVLARSCALADGLATAAMLFSNKEEINKWISNIQQTYPETQFWIESRNN